ncbi:MAG: 1,2-phenylacetyl-CoA epoxidase subunit PaaD [Phycisphaerales bacterium]|nr:1,2-phenylacetyl-CoA epoxidase subunit PaaD [Phycisphaerales bacterium]
MSPSEPGAQATGRPVPDGELPISHCPLGEAEIGNRKLEIGNPRIAAIWRALETVTDPEIPVISVVDMGIIAGVRVEDRRAAVDMTPTFVGCPALAMIRENIASAVRAVGEVEVEVNVVFDPPWSSDRITEEGRRKLKAFGLAPPVRACGAASVAPSLERIGCPYCDSTNTDVESIFGPTLCRSIHYCRDCLQSFEHFKPV